MKNIFCIVGESGSGKTYYNNSIILDNRFMKKAKLEPLIYGTTRDPRPEEKNGVDYNFISVKEYEDIPKEQLIEFRTYSTIDGKKHYFTLTKYIEESKKDNLICTASLYQYESYRNWISTENIKHPNSYALYLIVLNANVKNRLYRILDKRCKNDKDVYEACRRIVEERAEFDQVKKRVPELMDPMSYNTVLFIDTNNISSEKNKENLDKIKQFIISKTSK
jgi:guanylate kinase